MSKRKIFFIFSSVVAIAFAAYSYIYKDHRDISKENARYNLTSAALSTAFEEDYQIATQKYLNQTILLRGSITEVESQALILDNRVYMTLETTLDSSLRIGAIVAIKGRCIGYDELLEWVKLDQAILIDESQ